MSKFSSTLMTEPPLSRTVIAAAGPDTPAPVTPPSARSSPLTACAVASFAPTPTSAAALTPAAPFDRNARRLTDSAAPLWVPRLLEFLPMSHPPGSCDIGWGNP